jgi:hypothetical protein
MNTLYLGLDACFKLKLKDRGLNDPDLGTRLLYFVNDSKYRAYLSDCNARNVPEEVCLLLVLDPVGLIDLRVQTLSCGSKLHAVNEAYTKYSRGYAVTGVVAVSCRHGLVRPTGVADLQKGEKYVCCRSKSLYH